MRADTLSSSIVCLVWREVNGGICIRISSHCICRQAERFGEAHNSRSRAAIVEAITGEETASVYKERFRDGASRHLT